MVYLWIKEIKTWLMDPSNADQEKSGKQKFIATSKTPTPSKLQAIGISNTKLRKYSSIKTRELKGEPFDEILKGLTKIWTEYYFEEYRIFVSSFLANTYWRKNHFTRELWEEIDEKWIPKIDYWTNSDAICIDILGYFPVTEEPYLSDLKRWNISDNFWRRRLSLITFIRLVRKNADSVKLLLPLVEHLLIKNEKDYYARKAIPWILREASKSNPQKIEEFLYKNKELLKNAEIKEASKYLNK